MTDSTLTTTQKREAIKIAKRKVQLAQEGLIAAFTREVLEGTLAAPEAQKAYKAYKALLDKAENATKLANAGRKAWYDSMDIEENRYGLRNDARIRVDKNKVYVVHKDAASVQSASARRHNRVNKPSVDDVIETLEHVALARPLVDKLEALSEFIDVELPTDMWLTTVDAYGALSDIDLTITSIIRSN